MAPRCAIARRSSAVCVLKGTKSPRVQKSCYTGPRKSPCPALLEQLLLESSSFPPQTDDAFFDSCHNLVLKPSKIDIPITQEKAKILTLPNELIGAILLESPDVQTAQAMSQSCRVFHNEYKYNERKILYQSLLCGMGPGVLAEALAVHRLRGTDFPDYRNDAENYISRYTKGEFSLPNLGDLTVMDLSQIVKHNQQFQELASYFHPRLLSKIRNPEYFSASKTYPPLLESICWRLYQMQHYCELFVKSWEAESVGLLNNWSAIDMSKLFLQLIPAAPTKEPVDVQRALFTQMYHSPNGIPKKFVGYRRVGGPNFNLYNLAVSTWMYYMS